MNNENNGNSQCCAQCGAPLNGTDMYCPNCGAASTQQQPSHYCPHCGSEVEGGARFCTACGKPIAPATPPQPSYVQQPQPDRLWPADDDNSSRLQSQRNLLVALVVVLVLLIVSGVIWFTQREGDAEVAAAPDTTVVQVTAAPEQIEMPQQQPEPAKVQPAQEQYEKQLTDEVEEMVEETIPSVIKGDGTDAAGEEITLGKAFDKADGLLEKLDKYYTVQNDEEGMAKVKSWRQKLAKLKQWCNTLGITGDDSTGSEQQ